MKNKRGFTLVELLVVIAIVALLSITVGVGSQKIKNNSDTTDSRDTLNKLFNAARIYYELSNIKSDEKKGINCTACPNGDSCNITISCLITNGLLDSDITNEVNPLKSDGKTTLTAGDTVNVAINSSGVKYASFSVIYSDNSVCGTVTDAELYSTDKTVKENVNSKLGGCS